MSTVLFWFRNDLRLHDQSALHAACQLGAQHLLPVVCLPDVQATTAWGFARIGPHRRAWLANTIRNLLKGLLDKRIQLLILNQPATSALPALARAVGASTIVCEDIAAPEEQAEAARLLAGAENVESALLVEHLDEVLDQIALHPDVEARFRRASTAAALAWLQDPATGAASLRFRDFLRHHGHRYHL